MAANIQGIDQEYKPWGGLAGAATGERRALVDFANQQALQQANLENVLKEVEARRAQSDFENPDMELWRQQGIIGKNKEQFARGELDYQTLDSNVKTKLAENLSKASQADIDATVNGLDMFISTASAGHPLAMQQALQGLPPQYQKVVQQLGPEKAVAYAKQLSDTIKAARADTPKLRGDMIAKDREYENQEIIHQGDRESREKISAAEIAARMADRAAQREATQATKDATTQFREEQEISRRLSVLNSEFKANEVELKRVSEELASVSMLPVPGKNATEKLANREKLRKEKLAEKSEIQARQDALRAEALRIGNLSKYANKKQQGTADNPIVLK